MREGGITRALYARGDVGRYEARHDSTYGHLGAGGALTRFADVRAANEVTRRGRETLDLMCRQLAARGVTLLEPRTPWNVSDP